MIEANCVLEKVEIGIFESTTYHIHKDYFTYLLVVTDFLVILLTGWFINFLDKSQRMYADDFEEETIQMNQFTLRFGGIPNDISYQGNEVILKA